MGEGHSIAPSARILGPVVIHSGVRIGEDVTIVGPALIGAGAQVADRAIVAHAMVGPQSQVPQDCTIRDRVWFNSLDDPDDVRPESSYQDRLERFGFDPDATSAINAVADVSNSWHLRWKRLFDVVAASIGLVLLSPLLLLVAILVRLESRGPILYRGEREGLGGRPFECLKFRTMQEGAHGLQHLLKAQDKLDGPHFKLDGDPRLTPVGRILRSLNVDELPQLFNVLRGDMSLVGPRPSPFRENQICVPWREGAAVGSSGRDRPLADLPQESLVRRFPSVDRVRPALRPADQPMARSEDPGRDRRHHCRPGAGARGMDGSPAAAGTSACRFA